MIVATAVLYNFVRFRNDPLDDPPADDEVHHVQAADERRLGNAVRQALIQQHFT